LHAGDSTGPFNTLADAQAAGAVALNYGAFVYAVMSFLILAIAIFLLIRSVNRLQPHEEPGPAAPEKECRIAFTPFPSKPFAARIALQNQILKP